MILSAGTGVAEEKGSRHDIREEYDRKGAKL
jgi:hypothetical protein